MSRRILLADDSVTIQKVIELTFMDGDYDVTAVSNGDEALAKLPEVQPDLVIADVHMPGANGYEVCRRAKAERPGVPVLLLVGTFEPFDETQARAVGADAHLKKPFDSQELLSLAQQLLDRGASALAPSPSPAMAPAVAPAPASFEVPEPTWGNFDLEEPEPGPAAAGPPSSPAPPLAASAQPGEDPAPAAEAVRSAGFNWSEPPPLGRVGEQTFELDDTDDALGIDDSLLHDEPALETPGMDEPFDIGALEPAESPFALPTAPPAEASGFAAPPSADERAGVPLGAAPLTSGLDEIEQHVHWAAEAAHETPPAEVPAPPAPAPAPAPAPPAVSTAAAAASAPAAVGSGGLSESEVDRIARRVVELLGDRTVRDIAWEVIPDMAEVVIKDRLRELESQVE